VKASNRVLLSAGLGTSIAVSGILGIGIIPGAFADEPTTTAPTTSEGGASSVSTSTDTPEQTKPGSTSATDPTSTTTAASDTPGQESSAAPSQPTVSPEAGPSTPNSPVPSTGTSSATSSTPTTPTTTQTTDPSQTSTPSPAPTTLPAPVVDANVEIFWAMDKGATPDNVSWPQYYADGTFLQCGIWYQADTYLASEAPKYYADGQLDLGEDYQSSTQRGAISWRFVYGGDCVVTVPLQPHDDTRIVDDHETKDCEAGFVTRIVTEVTTTFVYQESDNTWNPVEQAPVTTSTTRPASEEECPVNTPTTPTPATTPAQTQPPGAVSNPGAEPITATHGTTSNAVSSPHTERLAQTGSNETMLYWFGGVLAALLLTMGVAGVVSGRRKNG
jgi:hypothetical protein